MNKAIILVIRQKMLSKKISKNFDSRSLKCCEICPFRGSVSKCLSNESMRLDNTYSSL